jgi:hypothetical protein
LSLLPVCLGCTLLPEPSPMDSIIIFQNTIKRKPNTKQTLWSLVRKRTIPTERLPHVGEI